MQRGSLSNSHTVRCRSLNMETDKQDDAADTSTASYAHTYVYVCTYILSPFHHFCLFLSEQNIIFPSKVASQRFNLFFIPFTRGDMGSSFSFLVQQDGGACPEPLPASPGLGDLPESCVALVLVHLDPKQICRLAMLNRAFRGASFADFVWESKLPVNYWALVRRVFRDENFPSLCKRDIFARLCTPNSIDGGTKVQPFLSLSSGITKNTHIYNRFFFLLV